MTNKKKPKVYLASNVFSPEEIGTNEKISLEIRKEIENLWMKLNKISHVKCFNGRFPSPTQIKVEIDNFNPIILGCHLSHSITPEMINGSNIVAIATATAGYNHIQKTKKDDILIAHTPGVLHETVADYTIALVMANLRNIVDLHEQVWNGKWNEGDKWDLDQQLSSVITNKTLGIVGLGEIGTELVKKLHPWGIKIIYNDIRRRADVEKRFPGIEFCTGLEQIFQKADIVSLHLPLNKNTQKIVNKDLLRLMKKNSLLINTARGGIIDLNDLLDLLEKKEVRINFSFDVYPEEPLTFKTLKRFKTIKEEQPDLRMILMPHNASADANTRGKMVIIHLNNIIKFVESKSIEDLKEVRIIPEHGNQLALKEWKIFEYWKNEK